jgi:hypothetical protein
MAPSSDGLPPVTPADAATQDDAAAPLVPASDPVAERKALLDSFKLRAKSVSGGQTTLVLNIAAYQRLRSWRAKLGMRVRFSEDGVSFGAAICVLLDLVELLGADLGGALSRDEFLDLARAYPYRGRKATREANVLPAHTSRDPRAPIALVRDANGAVFSYGHRWKLARMASQTDWPYMDFCTKCGDRRYSYDEDPNTRPCKFAQEPDDFVGFHFQRQQAENSDTRLEWKTPDGQHGPSGDSGPVDGGT